MTVAFNTSLDCAGYRAVLSDDDEDSAGHTCHPAVAMHIFSACMQWGHKGQAGLEAGRRSEVKT